MSENMQEEERVINFGTLDLQNDVQSYDATWAIDFLARKLQEAMENLALQDVKLNAHTIKDSFPLPIIDVMINEIAGHEMYNVLDGYSGYNQLNIAPKDQAKTTFITKWGAFMHLVRAFGLCNALATFQ
ncbi:hypothetical protein L7F22_024452 [Adiantum nelumboides]|nr:hypothetical protein [Adiantum nelumboides]